MTKSMIWHGQLEIPICSRLELTTTFWVIAGLPISPSPILIQVQYYILASIPALKVINDNLEQQCIVCANPL
jgi:hypothetical protein